LRRNAPPSFSERNLPLVLKEAEGLAAAGRLWVFGGFEGDGFTHMGRITLSYEPGPDRWARHADIPVDGGVSHCGQTTDGIRVYLLGGMQVSNATVLCLDSCQNHGASGQQKR